jgi:predicted NAD-dependent protein-ADP-ribosyltransferase YbiA (DUF1768 family)
MYPATCVIGGYVFPCSETGYMAFKANDRKLVETMIAEQWSGFRSKKFFRVTPSAVRVDWSSIQPDAMWTALSSKFCPSSNMLDRLMRVPEALLVERNTWGDRYWGVDYYTGRGDNTLGRMLKALQQQNSGCRFTDDTDFVSRLRLIDL